MTALRRVAPLPLLLLLLVGVLAVLVLSSSDSAQAQSPPASSGDASGYNGPEPTPPPEYRVPVNWPLIPSGLGPGDSFRLMFLTSNKRDAASRVIGPYLAFVQGRANAGHASIRPYGNAFRPVISTEDNDLDAQDISGYSSDVHFSGPGKEPVYWLNGAKVADNAHDFWDISWDSHAARDELGRDMSHLSLEDKRAWTGSNVFGYRFWAAGNARVRSGIQTTGHEVDNIDRPNNEHHRLYAMSPVFTVDHTRARATFAVAETLHDSACPSTRTYYNPRYLSGPAVVYPGQTYIYTFTHNAVKLADTSAFSCSDAGASRRGYIGIIAGTGAVDRESDGNPNAAAWLNAPNERAVTQAADSSLVGKNSVCWDSGIFHRTQSRQMAVYVPNNAPRGSTFHIAFFGGGCNGTVDTRSGPGGHGWGLRGANQVELGTFGTVTVAPVPDAPAKPSFSRLTRNQIRLQWPANSHDGSDFIYNYGVSLRRLQPNGTFTDWYWAENVNHHDGTIIVTIDGLQHNTHYQARTFARARMWSGGRTYYGPDSDELGFTTRHEDDPDPPDTPELDWVRYDRARFDWNAPSHTGRAPIYEYPVYIRHRTGSTWSTWEWAANTGGTERELSDLTPLRRYQVRVAAKNRQGTDDSTVRWSEWSDPLEFTTPSPVPDEPDKPTLSELNHNSLKVHWPALTNVGSERVYSYAVEMRRLDGGTFTSWSQAINSVSAGPSALTAEVTGLQPDTHYQVRTFARARLSHVPNKTYYSPASDERGFTTRTLRPAAPASPVLSNPQTLPQRIDVNWEAPDWPGATDIHDYDLQVQVGSTWRSSAPGASGTGTSLTLRGYHDGTGEQALDPGTEYRVRVRANNQDGDGNTRNGDWSQASSFAETLPGAPGEPDEPTLSDITHDSVTASWSPPSFTGASQIHDYDLEVRLPGGAWAASHPAIHVAETSLVVLGLNYYGTNNPIDFAPSTDYQVRVRANNRDTSTTPPTTRRGVWSAEVSFRTGPGAPTGLLALPGDGAATLTWSSPQGSGPGDLHRYEIEQAAGDQFTNAPTEQAVAVHGVEVPADWPLIPSGLGPGDTFRLLFVTSDRRDARSSDIADYNGFVQAQANTGHQAIRSFSGEFTALASTAAVDARDNTATTQNAGYRGVPIHWVNGSRAADDYADLYDGDWDSNAYRFPDGSGSQSNLLVWTGSRSDGTAHPGHALGADSPRVGQTRFSADNEIASVDLLGNPSFHNDNNTEYLYGLSPLITVVGPNTLAVTPSEPEVTVTGLANGAERHFRVRALRGDGVGGAWSEPARATPQGPTDYDSDDDGLIEIRTLAQLDAVRLDLDGDGQVSAAGATAYALAFPVAVDGMGCPSGCRGYELAADLDFDANGDDAIDAGDPYWNGGAGWLPLGTSDTAEDETASYTAVFHGNGRIIRNLNFGRGSTNRVGLFAAIGSGGLVRDLGLANANVRGGHGVGALAGVSDGTVRRSWAGGEVRGSGPNVGGLVGWNGTGGRIEDSHTTAQVSAGNNSVGGLAGRSKGHVSGSYATGNVSNDDGQNVGGLVGWNDGGSISRSYATGRVSTDLGSNAGGLAGQNSGSVSATYAAGSVHYAVRYDSVLEAEVAGHTVGGLVGWNNGGSIADSYAAGGLRQTDVTVTNIGGLVGISDHGGTIARSLWSLERAGPSRLFGHGADDTSGDGFVTGSETNTIPGRSDQEMRTPTDATGIYDGWSTDDWDFGAEYNFPALLADHDGDGRATWQEFGLQRGPGSVSGLTVAREQRNGDEWRVFTWEAPADLGSGGNVEYEHRSSFDGGETWGIWISGPSFETNAPNTDAFEVRGRTTQAVFPLGPVARIGPPGAVESLTVYPHDRGLGLSWSPPSQDGGAPVDGYSIQWRRAGETPEAEWIDVEMNDGAGGTTTLLPLTGDTRVTLRALALFDLDIDSFTNDQTHDLRMAARNVMGTGPWAEAEGTPSTDERKSGVPRGLTLTPEDRGITLSWFLPLDPGEPIVETGQYLVAIREAGTSNWMEFNVNSAFDYYAQPTIVPATYTFNVVPCDPGLDPRPSVCGLLVNGTEYEVRLAADNGVDSENKLWTAIKSVTPQAPDTAGAPQNLTLRPADGLLVVLWDVPDYLGNPELHGYTLEYRESGALVWTKPFDDPNTPEVEITTGTDTEIDGLTNGEEYQVRVAAVNASGTGGADAAGPWAEGSATPQALQQAQATLPGAPRNLLLTPGVGQLTARWDAPSQPDPNHTGYIVQYRAADSMTWIDATRIVYGDTDNDPNTPEVAETPESRVAAITGLAAGSYQVRVGTLLTQGAGQVSGSFTAPQTAEATAPRPPGPPGNVTVEIKTSPNDGSRRIEVSWDPPGDVGNPPGILGYLVQYREAGDPEWTEWPHDGTSTSATITGIKPAGSYEVRVLTIGVVGNTGEPATFGEAHRPPTAPARLTLTPGDGRIKAEWEPPADPGHPPLAAYVVSYRLDGTPTWHQSSQTGRFKVFTGLTNGLLYHVRVSVFNVTGAGAALTLSVRPSAEGGDPVSTAPPPPAEPEPEPGEPRLPGEPRNLTLTPGDGKLTAAWDAPEDLGNPPLTHYVAEYRADGAPASTPWMGGNEGGTTTTFAGLENGVTYWVRVWAVNEEGASGMAGASATPEAPRGEQPRLPGPPRNLDLTPGDGRIEVSWDPPEDPGHPALGEYLVEHRADGASEWQERRQPGATVTLDGLENGRLYRLRVSALNSEGRSAPAEGSARPVPPPERDEEERVPGPPRNLTLTPGDGQITASWDPPEDLGHPALDRYLVQYRKGSEPGNWRQLDEIRSGTSAVIGGLDNGEEYLVQVVGVNDRGPGPGAGPERATPQGEASRVPGPPRNLRLIPGDGKLTAAWDPPEDPGNPPMSEYRVEHRLDGSPASNPWIGGNQGETVRTFEGLENGVSYTVRVYAVNKEGRSEAVSASARPEAPPEQPEPEEERPPAAPRNLVLTPGDGRIEVSWDPPEDRGNPALSEYLVEHRADGASGWQERRQSGTALVLDGLENGQLYRVRVSAINSEGRSDATEGSATPLAPPEDEEEERPPTAPRNLELTPGDGQIGVSWDAPADRGNPPLDSYHVAYREAGSNSWANLQPDASETRLTITGLTNGVTYEVEVRAVSGQGLGPAAGPLTATPQPPEEEKRPPTAPRNLELTPGDGRIEVSWDPPEDLGNPEIEEYIVQYRKDAEPGSWSQLNGGGGTSAVITGLDNGEEYLVRVSAFNSEGLATAGPERATPEGEGTGAGGQGDEERPPTAPRNLELTPGDGRIEVSWDPPEDPGNPEIEEYFVEYQEVGGSRWLDGGLTTDTGIAIESLDNDTEYEVRVAVFNVHGQAVTEPERATPSAG